MDHGIVGSRGGGFGLDHQLEPIIISPSETNRSIIVGSADAETLYTNSVRYTFPESASSDGGKFVTTNTFEKVLSDCNPSLSTPTFNKLTIYSDSFEDENGNYINNELDGHGFGTADIDTTFYSQGIKVVNADSDEDYNLYFPPFESGTIALSDKKTHILNGVTGTS
jgi:hypothetical protein